MTCGNFRLPKLGNAENLHSNSLKKIASIYIWKCWEASFIQKTESVGVLLGILALSTLVLGVQDVSTQVFIGDSHGSDGDRKHFCEIMEWVKQESQSNFPA